MIRYLRLFSDALGDTHFVVVIAETIAGAPGQRSSVAMTTTAVAFVALPAQLEPTSWAPHASRRIAVWLAGRSTLEARDGTTQELGPGDVLLAEDIGGKGHRTHHIEDVCLAIVELRS